MAVLPEVDYDGEIAERYEDGRSLSAEALQTWTGAVVPHVPTDGAIVDVGAGTGRFARPLSALARRTVIAVEPSTGMRRPTAGSDTDVVWLAGAAEALPLVAESIGMVWSAFTTHYFDLDRVGPELVRVLRRGGRALIWHAFADVFDDLEWFRWFPTARPIDEGRMPPAEAVIDAFESAGLVFSGRTDHRMLIAADLSALADRLAYRSISTLHLISDREFDDGLQRLRAAAARRAPEPVYARNVLLQFDKPA